MIRKLLTVAIALFVLAGGVFAGEYKGKITKIDGDKVTIVLKAKKGEKGEEKTFTVDSKVKVAKVAKGAEEALADGLKNEIFTKLGKKGLNATVITTGEGAAEKASEIKVGGGKKKKKAAQ
jgi:hypothetical protein